MADISINKKKRAVAALLLEIALKRKKKRVQYSRSIWRKSWIARRDAKGAYHTLIQELRLEDQESYRGYLRMSASCFEELLEKVKPMLVKQTTNMRKPIDPGERLAITLRFLATGESYSSLMYQFRVGKSTISKMIPEVCGAIYNILKDEVLCMPQSEEEWKIIADQFEQHWQFPNCFGAMDGKHIKIIHPRKSGSDFYNYKGWFSIVLLALVDYNYKFTYVDVGCQGRISDGGVYRNCSFFESLVQNKLKLPPPKPLPQSEDPQWNENGDDNLPVPYVVVGDDAFPLSTHCMKPYPNKSLGEEKRIFNYRLSRVRRISENVFGIWGNRFRIFHTSICLNPDVATKVVLATVVLHNYLREKSPDTYIGMGSVDTEMENGNILQGKWRQESPPEISCLPRMGGNRPTGSAEEIRDQFCRFFNGVGQVPWQWKCLV